MITVIAEHSVDLDLLPPKAHILDAGCRGFEFGDELRRLGHIVYEVDCDVLDTKRVYHRLAIAAENGTAAVVKTNDPQARHIKDGVEIEKLTIGDFAKRQGVKQFDLVKLDIEGEEVDILLRAQHPIAKQVSVEFHAHCREDQTKTQLDMLLGHLMQWYKIHNQVWEPRHGVGHNYWDVLLIAK